MKILALADIHGEAELIVQIGVPLREADLVLLAGDITNFGGRKEAQRILQALSQFNSNILAVHGNCDLPAVEELLQQMELNLDSRRKTLHDINFVGIGGSLPCPGMTPSEIGESVFGDILDSFSFSSEKSGLPLVFLSHQPPHGTKLDAVGEDRHTGSRAIRRFIEQNHPILAVSGHIHEARGKDTLNNTVLVNPGPFRKGYYAIIEVEDRPISVKFYSV